jgi:plasmid stabilization system protein ParE
MLALPRPKLRTTYYVQSIGLRGWIAERPLARRSREELMPGLRSALTRPYTIFFRIRDDEFFFRIRDDELEIVRVLHERRDLPAAFAQEPE